MKTIALRTSLLLLVTTSLAQAQFVRSYGLAVGPMLAEQRFEYTSLSQDAPPPNYPEKPLWGVDAGAFVEFFNVPHFSLLSGLHYSQKGRIVTVNATALDPNSPQGYIDLGPRDETLRFHYISVPVLAKLRLEMPTITPFLAAGSRIEYLLAYPPSPVYDQFTKVEVTASISVGLEASLGFCSKLLFEATYLPGITHTYQNEFVTVTSRAATFTVGVAF